MASASPSCRPSTFRSIGLMPRTSFFRRTLAWRSALDDLPDALGRDQGGGRVGGGRAARPAPCPRQGLVDVA
jgi:hypothetical protein